MTASAMAASTFFRIDFKNRDRKSLKTRPCSYRVAFDLLSIKRTYLVACTSSVSSLLSTRSCTTPWNDLVLLWSPYPSTFAHQSPRTATCSLMSTRSSYSISLKPGCAGVLAIYDLRATLGRVGADEVICDSDCLEDQS